MLIIISKIHHLIKTSLNVFQTFLCLANLLYCTVILYISVSNVLKDHHHYFVFNTADKSNFSVSDDVFYSNKFQKNLFENSRSFSEKVVGYFIFLYFFFIKLHLTFNGYKSFLFHTLPNKT